MSRTSFWQFASIVAVVTTGCLVQSSVMAQQVDVKSSHQASLHAYTTPDGETCFALGLRGKAVERLVRDHVVLVDTSASQFGEHRTQAFAVLKSFLAALPQEDRVSLVAVDVATKQLSKGFVAPRGDEIDAAVKALNSRFPAGATNLPAAIDVALKSFDTQRPGSVLYIGDGMSTANLLQQSDLNSLMNQLRERQVAVHSYAVGPQTDLPLLGIIGQQTGGVVLFDSREDKRANPADAGQRLADAVDLPVQYPNTIEVADAEVKLLPNSALPLRSDRETIYLGKGKLPAMLYVSVADGTNSQQW